MSSHLIEAIETVYANVRLEEGISRIHDLLIAAYLWEGISVKQLSTLLFLPVPVVSAIKNELKKQSFLNTQNGLRLTAAGNQFVEENLGYRDVDRNTLNSILNKPDIDLLDFEEELKMLEEIYQNRPPVDVTVDQSLCTVETGIKRAVLMLKSGALIGKKIACIGDDDLVSVAILLILRHISTDKSVPIMADITVFDIDERVLRYIRETASAMNARVNCVLHDLRDDLPEEYIHRFDCAITDPPYTPEGLALFLSRGVSALKRESNLYSFLSFAHKGPMGMLSMQRLIADMGLIFVEMYNKYNTYNGAQILGGVSDMLVLNTTEQTTEKVSGKYQGPVYTNELNRTTRTYECANCQTKYSVGHSEEITTVEQLKAKGCPQCGANTFILQKRIREK